MGDPREEADWILTAQLPDGALATHSDRTFVNPYLGGFAATGLAAATRATGNGAYAEAAWRFVEWYAAHMDARGYVTDYQVAGGTPRLDRRRRLDRRVRGPVPARGRGRADGRTRTAPGSSRSPRRFGAASRRSARRSVRTVSTGAKPSWMVAYLMNEAEAFAGLQAGDAARADDR